MKTPLFRDLPDPDDLAALPEEDWEITAVFPAQWHGRCVINRDHEIKRKSMIGYVAHPSNPMLPVQGVACAECVKMFPRAGR